MNFQSYQIEIGGDLNFRKIFQLIGKLFIGDGFDWYFVGDDLLKDNIESSLFLFTREGINLVESGTTDEFLLG